MRNPVSVRCEIRHGISRNVFPDETAVRTSIGRSCWLLQVRHGAPVCGETAAATVVEAEVVLRPNACVAEPVSSCPVRSVATERTAAAGYYA